MQALNTIFQFHFFRTYIYQFLLPRFLLAPSDLSHNIKYSLNLIAKTPLVIK